MTYPTTRTAAANIVDELYGYPGGKYCTESGVSLILGLIRDRGLSVFSDAGIIALANRHMDLHAMPCAENVRRIADMEARA